jgi:hypothetical protein
VKSEQIMTSGTRRRESGRTSSGDLRFVPAPQWIAIYGNDWLERAETVDELAQSLTESLTSKKAFLLHV